MRLPKRDLLKKPLGFTLVELLIVVGILSVLLSIVLVAINPTRQFAQARNAQRRNDISALLNAVYQYSADNNGNLPTTITTTALTAKSGTGGADICSNLVTTYLASMPYDPSGGSYTSCSSYDTKYTILKSATNNRVTVSAPDAELGIPISVNR